jgi:RimJ/RimL family protein N-acetyltransferase
MIYELKQADYHKVKPLFESLATYNVAISALLDGINPGSILVDDPDTPQSAFMQTVECQHLAGNPQNQTFITALNRHFHEHYFTDDPTSNGDFYFCVPDDWVAPIADVLTPRVPLTVRRRHYSCTQLKYANWREHIPDGFSVRRIDDNLFDSDDLIIPPDILKWMRWNWGNREQYREHGFGFCTLHGNKVVSWSLADCVSGKRCEIGIRTDADYRQQGLAAITAAAAVDYALTNGFVSVGWHCDDANSGSWKTAEKVGFAKERDYTQYYALFSSVQHLAEQS